MKKVYFIVFLNICFGWVGAQYYYFDTGSVSYPYQQGCEEKLLVRVSTESYANGAKAGRLHLLLDPQHISYSTSDIRTTLFEASTATFLDWSSESSPSWKVGSNFSNLQIDRKNNLYVYNGATGLYGTISFVPRYASTSYSATFGMEYNGEVGTSNSTIETTLSSPFGTEIINPTKQYQHMTGNYLILQQPCVSDQTPPSISLSSPIHGGTKQTNIGISLRVADVAGSSSNVPYVWTGGNVWTGNSWGIDPQYGIDISTLTISLSGNGQNRSFVGGTYASPEQKTWQFLDKNYTISIPAYQIFDYGIEKTITMTVSVKDRVGLSASQSISFNQPKGPTLIPGTRFPVSNASFVNYNAPIRFGVEDDWAGVDSGSIVVSLSGINGTTYGPYLLSGNLLSLSGLASLALQPNWMVEVSSHPDFPASGTILVHVSVRDMEGNQGTISDYIFSTRPSCSQLGCCDDKYLQYKTTSLLLLRPSLTIDGGLNPYFSRGADGTGYVDCGLINQGMFIYKGTEVDSGSAQSAGFFEGTSLRIMGNNVKAILSGTTLLLQRIFDYGSLSQGGGWGGGSSILDKDRCPDGDNSDSYYDNSCEGGHGSADVCPVDDSPYTQELTTAFQFAYGLGITTMCPIQSADMTGTLLRKHMAKMITEFAVTTVGLYPDITKEECAQYDDMEGQSSEMKFYSKMACQLGLMGLESDGIQPQKSFNPNEVVTRAQFGTILSRLIFGETYNVDQSNSSMYYTKHLQALKDNKIMNKIEDPFMVEVRGWVMLMLQRTYESGIIDEYRMLHNSANSIRILYEF